MTLSIARTLPWQMVHVASTSSAGWGATTWAGCGCRPAAGLDSSLLGLGEVTDVGLVEELDVVRHPMHSFPLDGLGRELRVDQAIGPQAPWASSLTISGFSEPWAGVPLTVAWQTRQNSTAGTVAAAPLVTSR